MYATHSTVLCCGTNSTLLFIHSLYCLCHSLYSVVVLTLLTIVFVKLLYEIKDHSFKSMYAILTLFVLYTLTILFVALHSLYCYYYSLFCFLHSLYGSSTNYLKFNTVFRKPLQSASSKSSTKPKNSRYFFLQ